MVMAVTTRGGLPVDRPWSWMLEEIIAAARDCETIRFELYQYNNELVLNVQTDQRQSRSRTRYTDGQFSICCCTCTSALDVVADVVDLDMTLSCWFLP